MSMTPPPLDYSASAYGYLPRRPAGVTPIAVIGIILGSLGMFCIGCSGLASIGMMNNPQVHLIHVDQAQNLRNAVMSIIGLVLAILLLAGSIGALRLAGWARRLLIIFAIAYPIFVVMRVANFSMNGGIVRMRTLPQFSQPPLPPNPTTQQVQIAQTIRQINPIFFGVLIFVGIIYFLQLLYCIWILIVMRREDVKAAFETGGNFPPPPPQEPFPPNPPGFGGYR